MPHELVRLRRDGADLAGSSLERALKRHVNGEVHFDRGTRALYATDASNYRQPPIGVVIPRRVEDALAALALCREQGVPVLPRGGGTSLAGQCCNRAVVIDCSRHLTGVQVDPASKLAFVEPGLVLDDLRRAAAPFGLTFGPDPATHNRCTLGGMLGNNSCGTHSMLAEFYGPGPRTSDQVVALDVVTYDGLALRAESMDASALAAACREGGRKGALYTGLARLRQRYGEHIRREFPRIPRRVSGYNLPALLEENGFQLGQALVGSEATCAFITGATVKLAPLLPKRVLVVLGFPDVFRAADAVPAIREHEPVACEAIDGRLVDQVKRLGWDRTPIELLPRGGAWLLVEFGADDAREAEQEAERLGRAFGNGQPVAIYEESEQQELLWNLRESGLGVTAFSPGEADCWPGWEDAAVPPEALGRYLREFDELLASHGRKGALYGHFGHGCVHTRIDFDLQSDAGIEDFSRFTLAAAQLVARHGGSLSGEHGDGQARSELLGVMYGPELVRAFEDFKTLWDPDHRMNPGKIVAPHGRTQDLRLRDFRPERPRLHLAMGQDGQDFAHAATRCVGVGLCRKTEGGTMCPSYMVTRDERHSTRGRAHLLWEMMRGELITDGFRSEEVRDALDLCLNCKACKSECPVNVDMATYKAEFMAHHYEGRLRSRDAYVFGFIHTWSGLGAHVPRLANFLTSAPGLGRVMKALTGVAAQREAPRFAPRSFRSTFRPRPNGGRKLLLWPDTFNDAFYPEILHAAVRVLRRAGYDVHIPRQRLCCGRPMVEHGWLDRIRQGWQHNLAELADDIAAGVPVVGIEPSCTVFFRDELGAMFPNEPRAERLATQTFTLGELLERTPTYRPPALDRKALYHFHCQQRAVLSNEAEPGLLRQAGCDVEVLDTGCCGMAGAFGFQERTYPLSEALANRALLPKLSETGAEVVLIADGFSCREQLRQLGGVRALHTAELLAQNLPEASEELEVQR